MSAPSFSSFPPSFSSFPDLETGPDAGHSRHADSNRDGKKKKRDKSQRDSRKDWTEHRNEDHPSKLDKERYHINDDQYKLPRSSKPRQRQNDLPHIFYSDRKGDILNLQYGGLHTGDLPKYHSIKGDRHVLGLPLSHVILRRAGKGVEIGLVSKFKVSSLTEYGSRALLARPPSRRLRAPTDPTRYQEVDGFIRIPSRKGNTTMEETYRSITFGGDDDNSDSASSDSVNDSSDSDVEERTPTSHQDALKSLEYEIQAHPDAVDKWMALLNQSLSTTPLSSKNATRARCEITVSILSRALSADPQNAHNITLRLAYLRAGEEIWHESKLKSEWGEALKVSGIDVQMEWLEWKIRRENQGVEGVIESALRAMNSLPDGEDGEFGRIRIFYRVATAIKSAGYQERAMAMFQAQAELTFNAPSKLPTMSLGTQLTEFEFFWESEQPRVGEEGAKGWAHWHGTPGQDAPPSKPATKPCLPDLDPYRQWANEELQADRQSYLPARADPSTLDPYSTILFSDIRPMLLKICSPKARSMFRIVWLAFIGLCVPGLSLASSHGIDWDDRWNLAFMTTSSYLNDIFPTDMDQKRRLPDAIAGVTIGKEQDYSSAFGLVRCWGSGVRLPLDIIPNTSTSKGVWSSEHVTNVDETLIRQVFRQLRTGKEDFEWDILALAFEASVNPKGALKLSKDVLSSNRDSLQYWSAHAQLARIRGRLDESRKIYQTVLIASKSKESEIEAALLWWNWAEMEWLAGGDQASLNVILASVGLQGPGNGVTFLRAKRCLDDNICTAKVSGGWKQCEAWVMLRALLELLTGQDPGGALIICDLHLPTGQAEILPRESLTTASLLMLYYYGVVLKRPMPPSILRDRASQALGEYQSNSIILGIFLEAEKGQGIWGRVRSLLGGSEGKMKDVSRRIEEVWVAGWQKGRWASEIERTRSGLAAAVEHERTRSSAVIWRIYLEFEIRVREPRRAKKLLFRAIGECPLVKELYLLAFGPLRSVFQGHELNALADTMAERGIRLHQGLDEVLDGREVGGEEQGSEDSSEDEIEQNARELRRLKPY